jgi:thioredoxin family protein
MNFQSYQQLFQDTINSPSPAAPYDKPAYLHYARLNWSRMNRWLKQAIISDRLSEQVMKIKEPQQWIVITEPWCGDAAHSVPLLHRISLLNPMISVDYQLRDSEPYLINSYLTNGSKSIPKLIVRSAQGTDLLTWGPRPAKCQVLFEKLQSTKADFDTVAAEIQKWYNAFASTELQDELTDLFRFASVFPGKTLPGVTNI